MKRVILISTVIMITFNVWGQLSKSLYVNSAGTLQNLLTETEANTLTTLVISGNIDARDFVFLRDKAKTVSDIDMSAATINAYSGIDGTNTGIQTEYAANEIPIYAFYNPFLLTYKSSLVSFKFPTNCTSIGYLAFYYNWNLAGSVYIPSSVKNISDYAFYGCFSITAFNTPNSNQRYSTLNGVLMSKAQDSIFVFPLAKTGTYSIPSTVKHIGSSAFENTSALSAITLTSTIESIGSYAFCNSSGITGTLTLPANLKRLDDGAFYGCYNLTGTVYIPASLTEMGNYCFLESNNIQSFNVNSLNAAYSSYNDVLYSKNRDTLFICPGGKTGTFEIPASVKLIGSHAFYKCNKIGTTLTIPAAVDYIGYYSFYGCTMISNFIVNSSNLYFKSENGVLLSKSGDRLISCPVSKSGEYQIPATVRYVDPAAMAFCNRLTGTLTIPAATEYIGDYAFYGCDLIAGFNVEQANTRYSSLDGVVFNEAADSLLICPLSKSGVYNVPYGVKHIGISAFDACTKLTDINLASTVESIGNYAFEYCSGLTVFEIPQKTTSIGAAAFYSCTNMQEISIANPQPPVVDYYTFDLINKTSCKLIVSPGVTNLYRNAPYWGEFVNIQETTFIDGVNDIQNDSVKIIRTENGIMVSAEFILSKIEVFDVHGRRLFYYYTTEKQANIALKKQSYYIIKIKNKSYKFIQ